MTDDHVSAQDDERDGLGEIYRRVHQFDRDCSLEAVRRYMQEIAEMERAIDRLLSDASQHSGSDPHRSPQGAGP